MFSFFGHEACGILTPQPRSTLHPLHWKTKSKLDHFSFFEKFPLTHSWSWEDGQWWQSMTPHYFSRAGGRVVGTSLAWQKAGLIHPHGDALKRYPPVPTQCDLTIQLSLQFCELSRMHLKMSFNCFLAKIHFCFLKPRNPSECLCFLNVK